MALSSIIRFSSRNQATSTVAKRLMFPTNSSPTQNLVNYSIRRNFTVSPQRFSSTNANHSKLWTAERMLSAGMLALVPGAIIYPSQALDVVLAASIVMHSHWGLEAIVTDYVRPILFGNLVPKLAHGLLIAFSAITLAGLFYFIYNDVGIGKAIRKLWAINAK